MDLFVASNASVTGGFGSHGERSEPWSFHSRTDTHASQKTLSVASHMSQPPLLRHYRGNTFFLIIDKRKC